MTKLEALKQYLIKRTTDVFVDMRWDFGHDDIPSHFASMGMLIIKIDNYTNLASLITDLCNEEFGMLGITSDDEDIAEVLGKIF